MAEKLLEEKYNEIVIRKAYWNYEKEENWLNEMAAKGLALTDYSWCRYVFEECEQEEYIYRIELLDNPAKHPESIAYIKFLEDTGVEFVASYMRWVFLRKKASAGPFDLYSDLDSKIKYYKKIRSFWTLFAVMEFTIGLSNVLLGIINPINFWSGIIVSSAGLGFLSLRHNVAKKIKKLTQEKKIRE